MNNKALHTLEFDKIIHRLIEKADSEPGKACCRSLVPATDIHAIRTAQQETADALSRLLRFGSTSFGGNRDLGYSLKSLDIGSSLTAPELIKIADFLENTARIKAYGREDKDTEKRDSLSSYFDALSPSHRFPKKSADACYPRRKWQMMPAPRSSVSVGELPYLSEKIPS